MSRHHAHAPRAKRRAPNLLSLGADEADLCRLIAGLHTDF